MKFYSLILSYSYLCCVSHLSVHFLANKFYFDAIFFSFQVMEDAGQDLVVRVAERRNDAAALPAHAPRGSGNSRQESFEDEEVS